jgi:NAD-dependent deacetylase
LLIIGGTSLTVYPAASYINYFNGPHLVVINKEQTISDSRADLVFHDSIGQVLDAVCKELNL